MSEKIEIDDAISLIYETTNSLIAVGSNLTNDGMIKTKYLREIGRKIYFQSKHYEKVKLKSLIEAILNSENQYKRTISFDILYRARRKFIDLGDKDFMYSIIYDYIDNWVHCDDFCTHSFHYWLSYNHEEVLNVVTLTDSSNSSIRRSSVVAFIKFAQRGEYLRESLNIIERLFDDSDYLVQKAIGWLIKVHIKYNPDNDELISWCLLYENNISARAKSYFNFNKHINKTSGR